MSCKSFLIFALTCALLKGVRAAKVKCGGDFAAFKDLDESRVTAAFRKNQCVKQIQRGFFVTKNTPQENSKLATFLNALVSGGQLHELTVETLAGISEKACEQLTGDDGLKISWSALVIGLAPPQRVKLPSACFRTHSIINHIVSTKDEASLNKLRALPVEEQVSDLYFSCLVTKTAMEKLIEKDKCSAITSNGLVHLGYDVKPDGEKGTQALTAACLSKIEANVWEEADMKLSDDGTTTWLSDIVGKIPPAAFDSTSDIKLSFPPKFYNYMNAEQIEHYINGGHNCKHLDLNIIVTKSFKLAISPACFAAALDATNLLSPATKLKFTSTFLQHAGNEKLFSKANWTSINAKVDYSDPDSFHLQQLHDIAIKVTDRADGKEICNSFKAHSAYANLFSTKAKFLNIEKLPYSCMNADIFYKFFPNKKDLVAKLSTEFLKVADIGKLLAYGNNIKPHLSDTQMMALFTGRAERCKKITAVDHLKGLTKSAIQKITKPCFDVIPKKDMSEETARAIVKDLLDEIIETVDDRFPKEMMEALTPVQIGKFDASKKETDPKRYCEHMHLGELNENSTKNLTPECFYHGLKNSSAGKLNLKHPFFANAKPDLFSAIPKDDGKLLKSFNPGMSGWGTMQEEHVKAILELADGLIGELDKQLSLGLSVAIKKLHRNPAIEIFHGKTLDYLEKWPVSFYHNERTLKKLGRSIVSKFGTLLLEQNGATKLFNFEFFRHVMTPEQFRVLFSPFGYEHCWKLHASLLENVNETTLKSIPVECLSKMQGWKELKDAPARRIVPNLDERAFSTVRVDLSGHVIKYLTSAQVTRLDESGAIRCQHLKPSHLLPQQAPFVDPTCYANAVSAAGKVAHKAGFLSRARPELFSTIDAGDLDKVLDTSKEWAQLSKEAVDKILARGTPFCRLLKGPKPGQVIKATAISAACFAEVPFAEQTLLIDSPMIAILAEDALKSMHVPPGTKPEEIVTLFKRIALARPALMASISAVPDGPHVCSVLSVLKADADLGSASKHVPDHCYKEMLDLGKIGAANLPKLSAGATKAVDMSGIVEKIDFSKYTLDNWAKLTPAICKLISKAQFDKVKKDQAISAMSGVCISELPFELTKDEIGKVGIAAIASASEAFVAHYYKLFSLTQFGALGVNAKGISSFASVSAEHVGALTATAINSIEPAAFATLDLPKFLAIKPAAAEAITLAQISQVNAEVVVKLSAEQAKHLGRSVPDKNKSPKLLFSKELYEQLDPKAQEFIELSAANNLRVGIVSVVIAAACVLAMA